MQFITSSAAKSAADLSTAGVMLVCQQLNIVCGVLVGTHSPCQNLEYLQHTLIPTNINEVVHINCLATKSKAVSTPPLWEKYRLLVYLDMKNSRGTGPTGPVRGESHCTSSIPCYLSKTPNLSHALSPTNLFHKLANRTKIPSAHGQTALQQTNTQTKAEY